MNKFTAHQFWTNGRCRCYPASLNVNDNIMVKLIDYTFWQILAVTVATWTPLQSVMKWQTLTLSVPPSVRQSSPGCVVPRLRRRAGRGSERTGRLQQEYQRESQHHSAASAVAWQAAWPGCLDCAPVVMPGIPLRPHTHTITWRHNAQTQRVSFFLSPVSTTRVDGPWTRVHFLVDGPSWRVSKNAPELTASTRAVNYGSGNRALMAHQHIKDKRPFREIVQL